MDQFSVICKYTQSSTSCNIGCGIARNFPGQAIEVGHGDGHPQLPDEHELAGGLVDLTVSTLLSNNARKVHVT